MNITWQKSIDENHSDFSVHKLIIIFKTSTFNGQHSITEMLHITSESLSLFTIHYYILALFDVSFKRLATHNDSIELPLVAGSLTLSGGKFAVVAK